MSAVVSVLRWLVFCHVGEICGETSEVDEPANIFPRARRGKVVLTGDTSPAFSRSASSSKRTSLGERSALVGDRDVARSDLVGDLDATRADLGGGEDVLCTGVGRWLLGPGADANEAVGERPSGLGEDVGVQMFS